MRRDDVSVFFASVFLVCATGFGYSQDRPDGTDVMTPERLGEMIGRIDETSENLGNGWSFSVDGTQVQLIYDVNADRMRMITPVDQVGNLEDGDLERLMQANYDSALDARYAIGRGVVWATFIHPLSTLEDEEFLSGMGQTVNLAVTYGTTYSSGALVFGGGDSQDQLLRQLIDDLLKKGLPI